MMRTGVFGLSPGVIVTVLAACASHSFAQNERPVILLDPALCSPDGDFTLESTNPYFPMGVGQQWVLEGGGEHVEITVLDETKVVAGVTTRIIEEREWDGGDLKEVSRNFFAQASDGTVCYFGEEVDPAEGVWRADDPGSAPGIIMPANPTPGQRFKMEIAPGSAEDEGEVVGISGTVIVPAGTFPGSIQILEIDPSDNEREFKFFAPNVGILIDDDIELVSY
jgi:hypothetical protein